eukprot:NODE_1313_length_912_cov_218.606369_g1267_i0.p1 GENE.NODE_1313_length_912_cov_218.606369_g1267_i0~~NODE_1313_length_912_cov_218.606369_g1267_i0.p1  ORF type:complete len:277 (-),score=38.02 NODE_1313_length_912_cov_218.606369_g1267_i0:15-845(-)
MTRFLLVAVLVGFAVLANAGMHECGQACTVNADCGGGTECNLCEGGRCLSGCSGNCTRDADCGDRNCKYCFEGICGNSPNHKCGQSCTANTTCYQGPGNNCKMCLMGKCSAGCGQKCDASSQCTKPCATCVNGLCEKDNVPCLGACKDDLDCDQTSPCNLCIAGKCGAGCGRSCATGANCLDTGCNVCRKHGSGLGTCAGHATAKCHAECATNSDCIGSGNTCEQCYFRKCLSTCNKTCIHDSDCGVTGCQHCVMKFGAKRCEYHADGSIPLKKRN